MQNSSCSSLRGEKVPYRNHNSNNKHSPTLSLFFSSLSVTLELFLLFDTEIRTVPRKACGFTSILEIRVVKFFPLCPWELKQFKLLYFLGWGGGGNGKNFLLEVSGNSLFISDTLQIVPSLCPGVSHCLLTWLTHWCLVELDSYKHSTEIIGKG